MERLYIVIFSILISLILGMIGYWLKTAHKEFKQLLKELMDSLNQLRQSITGIEIQIEKGVEADISEMKSDIKTLYDKTEQNTSNIASLKGASNK